jgi:hypothetical protein
MNSGVDSGVDVGKAAEVAREDDEGVDGTVPRLIRQVVRTSVLPKGF